MQRSGFFWRELTIFCVSFKVNSALLSRCKVFVLKQLDQKQIEAILTRALQKWRGDTVVDASKDKEALEQLAVYSDGDGM